MKIAHEAPLQILRDVDKVTDYSYFLVHLFEELPEYLKWAEEVVASGRESLLDNSIFELGVAFDSAKYAAWIKHLKPTYYIIPDCLEDKDQTIANYNTFTETYKDLPGKTIAVAQGKTYEEFVECYKYLEPKVDKIAISFDLSFFEDLFNNTHAEFKDSALVTRLDKLTLARSILLKKMLKDGVINRNKKHHLLGCNLAWEFKLYQDKEQFAFIDSLDTSNPVVAGLQGKLYEEQVGGWGLTEKPREKLFTLMKDEISVEQKQVILNNIQRFRDNIIA